MIPIVQTKTGPDGFTRATLDGVGRTIRMERGTSATAIQSVVDTVYAPCACSPLGKLKKVSKPYAPAGTVYWTTYTYDAIGRTIGVQKPDGASSTTYSYSGNQTTVTDPAGNWKTMTSDSLGNLITVLEPDPASSGTLTTAYTYDWMNHVSQVTMTRGSTTQIRTFNYNDQGDLTSSVTPESGTASYFYNANHTLWYQHDSKGQDTVYSYDSSLRVTEIQRYPTGMSNTEDACARVTNYYNTNPFNPTFSANTVNRLAATAFGSWGTSGCLAGENQHAWYQMYSYHPAGVVTLKQLAVSGGSAVTASYTYDTAGRTVTRTYPMAIGGSTQNDTFTSTFDGMGRTVSLTGSESPSPLTWVQNVQYDFAGRMSSLQYLAGTGYTTEAKGFNANGQLTSMAWSGSASPVTGTLQYGYSATQNNGQIAQVVDSISGETIVYQYDSLKRLTSAASAPNTGSPVAAWTQTFQYDGFGNQTAQVLNGTTTAIPVDATTNRLSSASYDSNGNMTSGVGATFTFDVANRAISAVELSGGAEYYGYAPDNRRIYKRLTSGAEEYTFYGGQGEKLGVYNLTGSTMSALRTDVWFAGKLISEDSNAVFQDRLGTNRASGARFHPYGDEITSTSNDREKFATYTRDSYTGLDYADQRFYASSYGRFNIPDSGAGSAKPSKPGTWNRFAYAGGDPVNLLDARGTDSCDPNESDSCLCWDDSYEYNGGIVPFVTCLSGDARTGPGKSGNLSGTLIEANQIKKTVLSQAQQALSDPNCASVFEGANGTPLTDASGNSLDPSTVLADLASGTAYGSIKFGATPPNTLATTNPSGIGYTFQGVYASNVNITLNLGAWFNDTSDDVITILHELGHAIADLSPGWTSGNSIKNDALSTDASTNNDFIIIRNCNWQVKQD